MRCRGGAPTSASCVQLQALEQGLREPLRGDGLRAAGPAGLCGQVHQQATPYLGLLPCTA